MTFGKELNLFPVRLREYRNPDAHNHEKIIEHFKTLPAQQSNLPEGVLTGEPTLHFTDHPETQLLMEFFEDCLGEWREVNQLYCDNLDITLAWFNYAPAHSGFGHPLHRHPMSYLSAVYYLTDGAPTYFEDPCTPRTSDTLDIFTHRDMTTDWGINEKVDAEPGKLVIFPSWLKHYSGRQTYDYDRWSVSFNAFPTGATNVGPWDCAQLNVSLQHPKVRGNMDG
jgi:hypothetical protein